VSSAPEATSTSTSVTVSEAAVISDAATNDAPAGAAVSNAASEALTEAVKELEAKAAAYAEQIRPPASLHEPAPVKDFKVAFPLAAPEPVAASVGAASMDGRTEAGPALESSQAAVEVPKVESAKPQAQHTAHQEFKQSDFEAAKPEEKLAEKNEQKQEEKGEEKLEAAKLEAPAPVIVPIAAKEDPPAATLPESASAFVKESPAGADAARQISSNEIASTTVSSEAVSKEKITTEIAAALDELAAGGMFDMAKKESEIAATTAAAWASWRRIRETGDAKSPSSSADQKEGTEASAQDEAAMAVAAGAEKSPEGAHSASKSDDIAGIVDSVLADLRPKIVEEISRKMGKKK
jgi:hypothetical protein